MDGGVSRSGAPQKKPCVGEGRIFTQMAKIQTRLVEDSPGDPMGDALSPKRPGAQSRADKSRGSAHPPGKPVRTAYNIASSPDGESVSRNVRWGEFELVQEDIDEIIEAEEAANRAICDRAVEQSPNPIGFATARRPISDPSYPLGLPKSCVGHAIREEIEAIQSTEMMPNACYPCLIFQWNPALFSINQKAASPANSEVWYDDEIAGRFGPPRIPPRIASRLEKHAAP